MCDVGSKLLQQGHLEEPCLGGPKPPQKDSAERKVHSWMRRTIHFLRLGSYLPSCLKVTVKPITSS